LLVNEQNVYTKSSFFSPSVTSHSNAAVGAAAAAAAAAARVIADADGVGDDYMVVEQLVMMASFRRHPSRLNTPSV